MYIWVLFKGDDIVSQPSMGLFITKIGFTCTLRKKSSVSVPITTIKTQILNSIDITCTMLATSLMNMNNFYTVN